MKREHSWQSYGHNRIITEYCEQLYINKFDCLDELHPSLERHNLPKLTQEKISNMNRPLSTKDIQSIINNLTKQKISGTDRLTDEFYPTVKEVVIPIVTVKKAEHWRIDAFELSCWRRLLRVPWTARRYSQSILKEISLEYSSEGLMAEAEAPILWPHDAKNWLIGKDSDAGKKTEGRRRRGRQRMR